jgi:hypothetical protein
MYLSDVEIAKIIRKDLKTAFPGVKFWVTSKNAIQVKWIDGPTKEAVETIAGKWQSVSKCEVSGEVLSGGNTYVFVDRLYSEAALRYGLKVQENKKFWNDIDFSSIAIREDIYEKGFQVVSQSSDPYSSFGYMSREFYKLLTITDLTNGVPAIGVDEVVEVVEAIEVIEEAEQAEESEEATVDTLETELEEKIQEVLEARADRYSDRKERRIERYETLAARHSAQSIAACNQSIEMSKRIPMGQPIHVGHYSEKSDRSYRDRVWNTMGRSVEHERTAEYYRDKANAASSNNAISSDDPEAIVKLKEKIAALEAKQELMKESNKIIRSGKSDEETIEILIAIGHSPEEAHRLMNPIAPYCKGYERFELTNNNANLKRCKDRLKALERSLIEAATKGDEQTEYPEYGLTVIQARSINRLQLDFEEKPNYKTREFVGKQGFKWSRSLNVWQRHLGNSSYALHTVLTRLKEIT